MWAGVVKQSPLSVVLLLPSALPTVQLVTLIPENTAVYKITTIKSGKIQTEKIAEKVDNNMFCTCSLLFKLLF